MAGADFPLALDGPADAGALVVLGHGAGAGGNSDFMATFARGLAARGIRTCRFDFPYMARGRRAPDPQPVLVSAFRDVVERVRDVAPRILLGGKSLGGRIASHVVAAGTRADGLIFLGYPLHPPGKPERIRDSHLYEIAAPMLFVEGTRDPFCPLATLERVAARLAAAEVVVIADGDHSLKVRASSGRTTAQAWAEAVDAVAAWVERLEPA